MIDFALIASQLERREADFLAAVAHGSNLRTADRQEDRARQRVRRLGLVAHCGKPKRWQISADGLAVVAALGELRK